MKKQITITLDERQADKLRQLAKNSTIRGSVSEYISQLVDNKTTGSWVLQYIAGGGGLSDYAVAYCPCCRTYLSAYTYPNFGLDDMHRTKVYSAHVLASDMHFRELTILDNARKIKLPNFCSNCGKSLISGG